MLVFIYYISYQLSHPYWHESKVLYKQVFMFLFISDFSDINDNEKVVSRALSVEEKKGNIVRLANGVYLRPKNTRFGIVYPSIDEMVMAIAQRDKVQIQPSGVTALNKLGLT